MNEPTWKVSVKKCNCQVEPWCEEHQETYCIHYCPLHLDIAKYREFIELIARMKTLEEHRTDGGDFDIADDIVVLDELIASAREITGIKPEKEE